MCSSSASLDTSGAIGVGASLPTQVVVHGREAAGGRWGHELPGDGWGNAEVCVWRPLAARAGAAACLSLAPALLPGFIISGFALFSRLRPYLPERTVSRKLLFARRITAWCALSTEWLGLARASLWS